MYNLMMNRARELAVNAGLGLIERYRLQKAESLARSETTRISKNSINRKHVSALMRLPHPIPYQGSKRSLARLIGEFVPSNVGTWYEPFAGSAAMTLWAAHRGVAKRYVIADSLEPIANLWRDLLVHPDKIADRYEQIWLGQNTAGHDYFNEVRDRYNSNKDAVDLLYLICRCVKNAVRFNRMGAFTQSVDKRRLGMRPDKMRAAIFGASSILARQTEVRVGDWIETTQDAKESDFLYMDPPYLGTSIGRDKRYAHQISQKKLIEGLSHLRERDIRFSLSYDGMTGGKEYGPPLPETLGLTRLLLHAGTSSQATLNGQSAETIESLYLSPGLAANRTGVIRPRALVQESLPL
jgi:DNA adenine methylase